MKNCMILLAGLLLITSCSKDENSDSIMDCSKSQQSYNTDNGTELNLTTQKWYLEKNNSGGGTINLTIAGSIVGDNATIRTYGDGEISDLDINIDTNNEFNEDVSISFSATSLPEGDIIENTIITVYSSTDTLEVELESCLLRY